MSKNILVTYASQTGFTAGVALEIGKTLLSSGVQADVLPIQSVTTLEPYDAVIMGSAIQGSKWLPEAMQFLKSHRSELAHKPFAAFLVCMTLAMRNSEKYLPHVRDFMMPVRSLVRPVNEGYFSGGLELKKIPRIPQRLMFGLSILFGVWSQGDHRDWDAIQQWTRETLPKLNGS